ASVLEACQALLVEEPGGGVRKAAVRIAGRLDPFGLEEERPARPEALEHVVGPGRDCDELGVGRAFNIGPAIGEGALETAVLVENDAGRDQRRPWQVVGKPVGTTAVFAKVQHSRWLRCLRWRTRTARNSGS